MKYLSYLFILVFVFLGQALSGTINVPADSSTIQGAMYGAGRLDTVLVAPGTYYESNLWTPNDSIYIIGAGGSENTIIECEGADFGFSLDSRTPFTRYIAGLSVNDAVVGCHIYGEHNVFLDDVIISACSTAVSFVADTMCLTNCRILNNYNYGLYSLVAVKSPEDIGGSTPETSGRYINDDYYYIENSVFKGNGIALDLNMEEEFATIKNCLIAENGHGLLYASSTQANLSISNSDFINNSSIGIYIYTSDIPEQYIDISNNIIIGNNIGIGVNDSYAGSYLSCNNVYGNIENDYSGFLDQTGLNGNISVDPLFCDPENSDYTLNGSSVCLSENNECVELIGAFEQGCPATLFCGNINSDGALNILDITFLVNYLYSDGPSPYRLDLADVNNDGSINILDLTYLIDYLYGEGDPPDCG